MTETRDVILVVDDDSSVLNVLVEIIERSGYNVLGAYSFKEALNKYENEIEKAVKIIIIDYQIPDEDFFESLQTISNSYPHIKVCVITGKIDKGLTQEISEKDCVRGFFQKPFKMDQLKDMLIKILNEE